jgi:aminoacrylate hydrolase
VPYAPVRAGELHYEMVGSGPPLVLVAGLGGLGSFWEPQLATLARCFTVLTYDHRGSGRSTRSAPPYSIDGMTEDLLALLDAVGFDAVRFVGHSTGGAIGQCVASRFPERVERLVLSATWTHCDSYFRRLFTLRRDIIVSERCDLYDRLATLLLYPPDWIVSHDHELGETSRPMTALDRHILVAKIEALLAFDSREFLPHIRCPALVLGARDDLIVPSYFSTALVDAIPGARLSMLESGGHYFPITRAHEFATLVEDFLTRSSAPGGSP